MTDAAPERSLPERAVTRRRLIQGVGLQLLIRVVGVATGVVVAAALARGLDHSDFGTLSLALSLSTMAATLLDLGFSPTAVRQMSLAPQNQPSIAGALIMIRIMGGIVGAALVIVVARIVDPAAIVISTLVATALLLAPLSALQPIAQARLRIGALNLLLLLQSALWTAVVVALAAFQAPLIAFAVGFLVVGCIQSLAMWFTYKSQVRIRFDGALCQLKSLFKTAWPIAIGGLFVTAYYRLDSVILFHYRGPVANAYFSAAYRFLDVLQVIPSTILSVTMPLLSATWRMNSEGKDRRQRLFFLSVSAIVAAALPASAGGALVAGTLTRAIYGADFAKAGNLLAVLLLALPAIGVGYLAVGLALSSGHTRLYAYVAAGGAVANVALNFWLIPTWGAPAAAWTTVATEYGVASILLLVLTRKVGVRLPWWTLGKAGIATILLIVAVFPLRQGPLPLSIAVGISVFAVAVVALRLLTKDEVRSLWSKERLQNF